MGFWIIGTAHLMPMTTEDVAALSKRRNPQCAGTGKLALPGVHETICPDCHHRVRVSGGQVVRHWWAHERRYGAGLRHAYDDAASPD